MIKVTDIVRDIIEEDEIALESLRRGLLNLSAYAAQVNNQVNQKTKKIVKIGTIVVALSRLTTKLTRSLPLRPPVTIEGLSIQSSLTEVTFEKTSENLKIIENIYTKLHEKDGLCTLTSGINEITMICSQKNYEKISECKIQKLGEYSNLAALTVKFKEKDYIEVPNMIYSLVSTLASKRINLIEVVSTFSEISFIFRQKDLQTAIDALQKHMA